jgi:Zn-dependent peptidase ImmA (M78 family)/transcriptional regulator with XRE-family HTH domain
MLKWGRTSAGFTVDAIAEAERLPPENIEKWENGEGTPTLAVLRRLGKRYNRPLMVFYLSEPPSDFSVVKDFRLLPANVSREWSPELRRAIRLAQSRQAWASDYLDTEGVPKSRVVGSLDQSSDIVVEARRFRSTLGVTIAEQMSTESPEAAFRLWRARLEDIGVYVFQISRVDTAEMRGCALSDPFAPVALVNVRDATTAKTFTLFHEVAHIMLGESAITGAGRYSFARSPNARIEKFCNHFAAELLVPANDLVARIPRDWKRRDDAIIQEAARKYRVSRAVIALRLVEVGLASESYLRNKWPLLQSRKKATKRREGGPPQHVLALSNAGGAFTRLTLSAYHGGQIHGGELSSLLGMKLKHLPQLESAVYPGRVQSLLGT